MVQSSAYALVALLSLFTLGASPGDKRTILTSGERVYTIYYQLGQSTVLYFGMKPETVICGNKNYFNIEKIKEGLTIQPLSNFSTNLTVLNQGKRFLFYMTPAKNGPVDTFIDVRWIPEAESRPVATAGTKSAQVVRELSQKIRIGVLDVVLKREIRMEATKRSILEFEIKNSTRNLVQTSEIEVLAVKSGRPINHQASVFEQDDVKAGAVATGRLIVTGSDLKGAALVINYLGKSGKVLLQGERH